MSKDEPTEEWRPIPGHDGYSASTQGRVRSEPRTSVARPGWRRRIHGGVLRGYRRGDGYQVYALGRHAKHKRGHILVMATFVGPCPPGLVVAHRNGDPQDNRLSNLRYATREENAADAARHGTRAMGEAVGTSKLTEADVLEIRARRAERAEDLGAEFGVTMGSVRNIWARRRWGWLS